MSIRTWLQGRNKRSLKSGQRRAAGYSHRCHPALERLEDRTQPSVISVIGRGDGPGVLTDLGSGQFTDTTLRGAIIAANSMDPSEPVNIDFDPTVFNAAGGDQIAFSSSLPAIQHGHVKVDDNDVPVTLDGSRLLDNGLVIQAADCQVSQLQIQACLNSGIVLSGPGAQTNQINNVNIIVPEGGIGVLIEGEASHNTISGSTISTNGDSIGIKLTGMGTTENTVEGCVLGTTGIENDYGVVIDAGATSNTIGGPPVSSNGFSNLIAGNMQDGVIITGNGTSNNLVEGNQIATHPYLPTTNGDLYGVLLTNGASNNTIGGQNGVIGNTFSGNYVGVAVDGGAHDNTIGSLMIGSGNKVVGSAIAGVGLGGIGTTGNIVEGNLIGDGTPAGSNNAGVSIGAGASNNLIGGPTQPAANMTAANIIAGNTIGIEIGGVSTNGNQVQGNSIMGGFFGVDVGVFTNDTTIGGSPATSNIITNNQSDGVHVVLGFVTEIQVNRIFDNAGLGINLGNDGVTPNTPGGLQNFPVLSPLCSNAVGFSLNSAPGQTFTLDFYANTAPDPSGYGEGEVWLNSMQVTTDMMTGNVNGTFHFTPVPGKQFITATATSASGGTSEFSAAVLARHARVVNRGLLIDADPGQKFRLLRDPVYPGLLDLEWDNDPSSLVSIDPTAFSEIDFAGSSDNEIDIEDVPAGVTLSVDAGTGNPVVNISPTGQDLDSIQGNLNIKGSGSGTLNFDDQNHPSADGYTLTSDTVSRPNAASIAYSGLSNISLNGGAGLGRSYAISNTAPGATTTITAANGDDVVNVEATLGPLTVNLAGSGNPIVNVSPTAGNLDTLGGSVTVASAGFGTVNLDDQAGTAGRNYALTSTSLSWGSPAVVTFGKLGSLVLNATAFNETVSVQSLPANAVALEGGKGSNTLVGPDTPNTWSIDEGGGAEGILNNSLVFDAFSNLTGGSSNDSFNVGPAALTQPLALDGDGGSNSLQGPEEPFTYWNLTGPDQGNVANVARQTGLLTFRNIGNLTGSTSGQDFFQFGRGTSLSGILDAGGGAHNNLDYSLFNTGVIVDLTGQNSGPGVFNGLGSATGTAGVRHIQNVIGTLYNDTLIGDDENNTLTGHGGNDVIMGNGGDDTIRFDTIQGSETTVDGGTGNDTLWAFDVTNNWDLTGPGTGVVNGDTFVNIENLLGGLAADTFHFLAGAKITGFVNGNRNLNNTLDYSQFSSPVSVNLDNTSYPFEQHATGTGYIVGIQNFVGSASANNSLQGANQDATWQLNASSSSSVTYAATAYQFSAFARLTGGTGVDVFALGPGATVGHLDGGGAPAGRGDWLDYSAYNAAVIVNLTAGTATGVSSGVAGIQDVFGSNFGNTLTGNGQGNILVGGTGSDIIAGGSGRSLLIGSSRNGSGPDQIMGGTGDDILIAGYTDYDHNTAALMDILVEWQTADTYTTRITRISQGVGASNARLVWGATVHDDGNGHNDTLFGDPPGSRTFGRDWFFVAVAKDIKDLNNRGRTSEQINSP
jgi:hypothetical protein